MRGSTSNLPLDTHGPVEGRYQILGRIASGAMGQIYLARARLSNGRTAEVALKRIKPELQKDRAFREMFYDEIRVASRMRHPNIIRLLEYGELDGSIFYSMELVPGINLADVIRDAFTKTTRIPFEIALGIGVQILDSLDYAHHFTDEDDRPLHLVHRDVSPQNVLLGYDGAVKLLDFGVTKAEGQLHKTQPGMIKGKLSYMAPEQIGNHPVDARTDLFALGVVLYEATLIQHPFPGRTDPAVITSIMRSNPPPPHEVDPRYPRRLSDILITALAKDPAKRFSSAAEMRTAISDFMDVRGWTVSSEALERLLGERFAEGIGLLRDARRDRDDGALVRALEIGTKKPLSELPALLPPPPLPTPLSSEEISTSDLIPPSVRRPSNIDTGDVPSVAPRSLPHIGRYQLLERLHAGAREVRVGVASGRRFAIKRPSTSPAALVAFLEELRPAIELSHPNLIQVFEVEEYEGEPYAALELIEGASLEQVLELCETRRNRMPVGVSCRIIADLCRALHYLHSRSIYHRDVAAKHVLLTRSGDVKLTHPRSKSPQSPYTPPERLASGLGPETPASDVYSVGVLLSECLAATMVTQSASLDEAVTRAMARAPDLRHESARALAADLEREIYERGEPITPLEVSDWLQQLLPGTASSDR